MAKSARIMTLSFGWEMGGERARRERTMTVVMEGWRRAWRRTSLPMKPVVPVRMTFILEGFLRVLLKSEGESIRAEALICDLFREEDFDLCCENLEMRMMLNYKIKINTRT